MPRNGAQKPPRPQIELVTEPASRSEAAAIVAALEQFLAETAPTPSTSAPAESPWRRAALREGISARTGHAPGSPWRT
jgi:hypothetical protein